MTYANDELSIFNGQLSKAKKCQGPRKPVFWTIPSPKRKNAIRRLGGATAQPNKIVGFHSKRYVVQLEEKIATAQPNKIVGFHCVPPDLQENGEGIVEKKPAF